MCSAPIYLESAPASSEVLAAEAAIIAREGRLSVCGYQCSNYSDADRLRRVEAECRVREAARRRNLLAKGCVWCGQPIDDGQDVVIISGRAMHVDGCQVDFDRFTYGCAPERRGEAV